jgi:hypothetical protein
MKNLKLKYIIYLFLTVVLFSCNISKPEVKFKKLVVNAKRIEYGAGYSRYVIAFTNGSSDNFSFGIYSKYEKGDTLIIKEVDGYEMVCVYCH